MDVVFIFDVSASIKNEANFQVMKDFVKSTFQMVNINENCTRVAVILFARVAWIKFSLTDYLDEVSLCNAIDAIKYGKISKFNHTGTNTPSALNLMRTAAQDGTLGMRNEMMRIAMFITDGRPNIKHMGIPNDMAIEATKIAAQRLHESNMYDLVYTIGIEGTKPIGNILNVIASSPSLVFPIQGFNATLFEKLTRSITSQFCNRKLLYIAELCACINTHS